MTNVVQETVIAANGFVAIAPVGTTLPGDASGALDAAFSELGYISDEGVTFSPGPETEGINAWQSLQPIRSVLTAYAVDASFTLMQWNEDTLGLAFGGGVYTDNGDGTWSYLLPKPEEHNEHSMVIEGYDGNDVYRIVLDRVELTDTGDITFQRSDVAGLPVTVSALAGLTEGRPGAIYGIDGDFTP